MKLKLGLSLRIERLHILLILLVEQIVLQVDQLGVGADEFVSSVVGGCILHGVLTVLDEKPELFLIVGPSVRLCHCMYCKVIELLLLIIINNCLVHNNDAVVFAAHVR